MAQRDIVVVYDISDPDRLRKVYKIMLGAGQHVQKSVFRCALSARSRQELIMALEGVIDTRDDQVLFVDLGPLDTQAARVEHLGRPYQAEERKARIL
ncbi:MAG: CRISPR-associated endonuclease Cas2 [Deltaproteobacteria bacterium]|nr:CRISPR-associated endonuclease Cas2 [Deltaproteobacteria bacterium]